MAKSKPIKSVCNFVTYIEKKDEYIVSYTAFSGTTTITETASGPSLKEASEVAKNQAKEVLHSKDLKDLRELREQESDFWTEDRRVFSSTGNATGKYGNSEAVRQGTGQTLPGNAKLNGGGRNPITVKQINFIKKLASECGCSAEETAISLYSKQLPELCGLEANEVIAHLKSLQKRR